MRSLHGAGDLLVAAVPRPSGGATSEAALTMDTRRGAPLKAILHTQYGSPDLLQFKEVDTPLPRTTKS